MGGFLKKINGYKSYALVCVAVVLTAVVHGPEGYDGINFAKLADPDLLLKEVFVLMLGAGRSAIGNLISEGSSDRR